MFQIALWQKALQAARRPYLRESSRGFHCQLISGPQVPAMDLGGTRLQADIDSRVMMYSHDTYGLGHLRRSLLLADELSRTPEIASILLTTGSPDAQTFALPDRCDTIKLPGLTKNSAGAYETRTLGVPLRQTISIRSEILVGTVASYRPSLIVVDHSPVGAEGELWPLLRKVRSVVDRPTMVLGLREIIDDPDRVSEEWQRSGAWTALEEIYDSILVYGDPSVLTTAQELGLPSRFPGKVRFTGYLTSQPTHKPQSGAPTIVVTVGGGGDGHHLLEAYTDFLTSPANPEGFRSVIVTGPYMEPSRRRVLQDRIRASPTPVVVHRMVEDLPTLIHSATGVITMAGYNTVAELLTSPARVLLAPRSQPRLEQTIRADRLAAPTGMEVLDNDRKGSHLADFVRSCLASGPRPLPPLQMHGQEQFAAHIRTLLAIRSERRAVAV